MKRYSLFSILSTKDNGKGKEDRSRFIGSILVLFVLLSIGLVAKCTASIRGQRHKATLLEQPDTKWLRPAFESWLTGGKDTTVLLNYECVSSNYDGQSGFVNNEKYSQLNRKKSAYTQLRSILNDSPERRRYELEQSRKDLKAKNDKNAPSRDSLYYALLEDKVQLLKASLSGIDNSNLLQAVEHVLEDIERELDEETNKPGVFVRARIMLLDSSAFLVDYLQREDTLLIINVKQL